MKWRLVGLTLLFAGWLAAAPPETYIPQFEKTLNENILGFWLPRALDQQIQTRRHGQPDDDDQP